MLYHVIRLEKELSEGESVDAIFESVAGLKYVIRITSYNFVPDEDYIKTNFHLKIYDLGGYKQLLNEKFYDELTKKFGISQEYLDGSHAQLICENISGNPTYTHINIYSINKLRINKLKFPSNQKRTLKGIIYNFISHKIGYRQVINEISILGEYIARELASKLKGRPFLDFGTAIDALSHHKMKKQGKINYTFLGALLWPLYYIRNQALHPYHKIGFSSHLAETLLHNLIEIVDYLIAKKISFM